MNTRKSLTIVTAAMLITLALAVGLTQAQGPGPGELQPQVEAGVAVVAPGAIPIQGRLTDANSRPLSSTYSIMFRLYEVGTGGTAVCSDTRSVNVVNGLFSDYMDGCYDDITGQKLWLGVKVGSDAEMTPRQVIYPVPYALSLRPGAVISDTLDGILTVRSTGGGDSDAFIAAASGTGEAIEAYATDGIGVFAKSDNYLALQAYSYAPSTPAYPAIFGCAAATAGACDPYRDDNRAGIMGYSQYDFGGYFKGQDGGVYAEGNGALSPAIFALNSSGVGMLVQNSSTASGNATLYLAQDNAGGDFVVGAASYLGTRYWRVDRTGRGFFNGGTQASGADFAEQMAVAGEETEYEPGDVLVISPSADKTVELSMKPFATTVIGVYSTQPAVLAGAPDTDEPLAGIPVGITGIVPCKVSAENGAIRRGDLLVTSSMPGHAMRAGDNPPQGAVLGKALGELKAGVGVIYVLVALQ